MAKKPLDPNNDERQRLLDLLFELENRNQGSYHEPSDFGISRKIEEAEKELADFEQEQAKDTKLLKLQKVVKELKNKLEETRLDWSKRVRIARRKYHKSGLSEEVKSLIRSLCDEWEKDVK